MSVKLSRFGLLTLVVLLTGASYANANSTAIVSAYTFTDLGTLGGQIVTPSPLIMPAKWQARRSLPLTTLTFTHTVGWITATDLLEPGPNGEAWPPPSTMQAKW